MPFYDHLCTNCNEEFEDFYSTVNNPPTICPLCNHDGGVKRLISADIAVKVPLTGQELIKNINDEKKKMKEKIKTDEKLRANIIGESKYNDLLSAQKKLKESYKT